MAWKRRIQYLTRRLSALIFILLAVGLAGSAYSQQLPSAASSSGQAIQPNPYKLVLNSADGPPLSKPDGTGILDLVLKDAFKRTGIEISIIAVPAERALLNANAGIDDGIFSRIAGMNERYPDLERVPEPLVDFEFVAFSRTVAAETKGWDSLKPFDVAIITGWKILEENVRDTKSLQKVRDEIILFNLLATDRVDVVVYSKLGGEQIIRELGLKGIKALEPPLARREMFLYLNKKHARLVVPLANELKMMKMNGDYRRIVERVAPP